MVKGKRSWSGLGVISSVKGGGGGVSCIKLLDGRQVGMCVCVCLCVYAFECFPFLLSLALGFTRSSSRNTHTHTQTRAHSHTHTHTHTLKYTHSNSHTHTLTHSHVHTLSHTYSLSLSLFFFPLSLSLSLSHSHTHTHTHTYTHIHLQATVEVLPLPPDELLRRAPTSINKPASTTPAPAVLSIHSPLTPTHHPHNLLPGPTPRTLPPPACLPLPPAASPQENGTDQETAEAPLTTRILSTHPPFISTSPSTPLSAQSPSDDTRTHTHSFKRCRLSPLPSPPLPPRYVLSVYHPCSLPLTERVRELIFI